jgi:hypothetical protein
VAERKNWVSQAGAVVVVAGISSDVVVGCSVVVVDAPSLVVVDVACAVVDVVEIRS